MPPDLRSELARRVVVADGAMGTMLQAHDLGAGRLRRARGLQRDPQRHPARRRPRRPRRLLRGRRRLRRDEHVRRQLGQPGEYGIADRIEELAEPAPRIAREAADAWSTPDRPALGARLGRARAPSCRRSATRRTRCCATRTRRRSRAWSTAASTRSWSRPRRTCCRPRPRSSAPSGRWPRAGVDLPVLVTVTVETTGTMLLGSEIGAALTALEPLGIDLIGLNCATGPAEMSEHLRYLSRHARIGVACMPNAGLPVLGQHGARYPLTPVELADALDTFVGEYGLGLVGGCCGTTPEHLRQVVERVRGRAVHAPPPAPGAGHRVALPERAVPAGHRLPLDRRADQRQRLQGVPRGDARRALERLRRDRPRRRPATARTCSTSASTTSAATAPPTCARSPAGSPPPRRCRSCSTRPSRRCFEAGLECLGGRAVINSVNYEDGDGPDSRFAQIMPLVREHGAAVIALTIDEEGQARTAEWKVRVADRLISDLTGNWGMRVQRHPRRLPDLPDRHRAGGDPPRRHRDDRGDPRGQAPVPRGADHARPVEHLVRPEPGRPRGAQLGVPARVHRTPGWTRRSCTRPRSCRWPGSPTSSARSRSTWSTTGAGRPPTPSPRTTRCSASSSCSRASTPRASGPTRADELAALPLAERLERRIIDGERNGLEADLDEALRTRPALEIVNDSLLDGHEDGRRAVRLRPDAAAVRAAVGRGDEDRGRLPRAAHGEDRRRRQGHDRAGHGQGRRPRHRQEPGRHHPDQQRLHGRQPRHQAADQRDPRGRRGAPAPTRSACPGCW